MKVRRVNRIPLQELWNDSGPVASVRHEYLNASAVRDLFRSGTPRVAVAACMAPLQWVTGTESFNHWKTEIQPNFMDGTQEEWCSDSDHFYVASRWTVDGDDVIVFEMYH